MINNLTSSLLRVFKEGLPGANYLLVLPDYYKLYLVLLMEMVVCWACGGWLLGGTSIYLLDHFQHPIFSCYGTAQCLRCPQFVSLHGSNLDPPNAFAQILINGNVSRAAT